MNYSYTLHDYSCTLIIRVTTSSILRRGVQIKFITHTEVCCFVLRYIRSNTAIYSQSSLVTIETYIYSSKLAVCFSKVW